LLSPGRIEEIPPQPEEVNRGTQEVMTKRNEVLEATTKNTGPPPPTVISPMRNSGLPLPVQVTPRTHASNLSMAEEIIVNRLLRPIVRSQERKAVLQQQAKDALIRSRIPTSGQRKWALKQTHSALSRPIHPERTFKGITPMRGRDVIPSPETETASRATTIYAPSRPSVHCPPELIRVLDPRPTQQTEVTSPSILSSEEEDIFFSPVTSPIRPVPSTTGVSPPNSPKGEKEKNPVPNSPPKENTLRELGTSYPDPGEKVENPSDPDTQVTSQQKEDLSKVGRTRRERRRKDPNEIVSPFQYKLNPARRERQIDEVKPPSPKRPEVETREGVVRSTLRKGFSFFRGTTSPPPTKEEILLRRIKTGKVSIELPSETGLQKKMALKLTRVEHDPSLSPSRRETLQQELQAQQIIRHQPRVVLDRLVLPTSQSKKELGARRRPIQIRMVPQRKHKREPETGRVTRAMYTRKEKQQQLSLQFGDSPPRKMKRESSSSEDSTSPM
jgi:hypothetical protein